MGDEDDFRARAMAMYQARGKTETTEAAKRVKKSVKKEMSTQLEKDDYRAAANKLYTLKGPEKLCEDCSSDSGRPGKRKKNAYYGMPGDRGLTVADRRRWCKTCAQKHEGAVFVSAKDDDDDDDQIASLAAKISNKTTAMAAKAEQAKKEAEKKEAMNEKGMFEAASSSESDFGDWTSSDEDDPEIRARRKRDREIQRKKAEELREKKKAEEEKTLAGKARALKEKGKDYLLKEDDPDKPPGEMYIPDPTNPDEPTDGRTFQDALDAKTDAEWERGFLRKQRYWLACCSFCNEVGPDCLMCNTEIPPNSLDQFIAENLDVIHVVNFRGSIEIIQDMNYTGLGDCTGEGAEEQCSAATAWPCDVDVTLPGNERAEGMRCKPQIYVNVSYFGVNKDVTRAVAVDAYLKDRVLRVTVGYDHEEGGWNTGACPEAHVQVVLSNVTSSTPGVGPVLNISLGHNLPKREALWEPWIGKKMAHKGIIEASFDPRIVFGGVHITNWVPGGNISVRGVATTHLALQAASGNVSVLGVDSSSVIALAGDDGRVDISHATLVSMSEITGQYGIEEEMDAVCLQDPKPEPCQAPRFYHRKEEEPFGGACCMDKRLQTVRGFNPHGSLHISTHMGHITVDQVAGHSSIDLSSIGGSIELLLDSASFSGTYGLTAPKGIVRLRERRFRTPYQFKPETMSKLFPNSTAGFLYLAMDEAIQMYETPPRRAWPTDSPDRLPAATSPAFPRKGRVLMAGDDGQTTGGQTLSISSAEGDVAVCITESVGGSQWGGNQSFVDQEMKNAYGEPTYRGPDTEPCRITLREWTGPSGAGRGADGSEPWFTDRMGGRYYELIDYCADPPTHDVPSDFDVDELC